MLVKSRSIFDRAEKLFPCGVNSPVRYYEPFPFFAVSGKEGTILSADKERYIDYCMGYGSLFLGHSNAKVTESVKSQIDNGSLFCVPTEKEVILAELISKAVDYARMIRLVNTGVEATTNAIRIARAFTKKRKILRFDGCYHGAQDFLLSSANNISEGVINEGNSQTLVLPYNDAEKLEQAIKHDDDIACVIIEPVAANMGWFCLKGTI